MQSNTRHATRAMQPALVRRQTTPAPGSLPDKGEFVDPAAHAQRLHALRDDSLNDHMAGQTDEQLQALGDALDPSTNINGGLSVDARTDLFNHLSVNLNVEQRGRWQQALSSPLQADFQSSLIRFGVINVSTDSNTSLVKFEQSEAQYRYRQLDQNPQHQVNEPTVSTALDYRSHAINPDAASSNAAHEAVNTQLLNRLEASSADEHGGVNQGAGATLSATIQDVVAALLAQGIVPSVTVDKQGRVYQDFRRGELPADTQASLVVSGPPGGNREGDPANATVRAFVENLGSAQRLGMAGRLSEQLHTLLGTP